MYESNAREKGVLDTTDYADEPNRSWLFRSIGYGHGESHWKDVVSTLRMVGYEGALSIEHEDSLTSPARASKRQWMCSTRCLRDRTRRRLLGRVVSDPDEAAFWTLTLRYCL